MTQQFDAIVIGTGQAGPSLAHRLSDAGMSVAVIERHRFGGTCVNTGCIPTKTLIASAYVAYMTRRARDYGVGISGQVTVDMRAVKARKDEMSERSRSSVERAMRGLKNAAVFTGTGRFEDSRTVRVNDHVLRADRIFINVGGRANVPPFPGIDRTPFLTNSGMMEVDFLPAHLVIVGGSYVGIEFAQMFRRFGSEVTIVEKDSRLVSREDEDVSGAIGEILEQEGIRIRLNATCITARQSQRGIAVGVECAEGAPEVEGSHLLLAVGRKPNTDDLGLDRAGVDTDERGYIRVDDQCRTNVPGIWALGDCNGRGAFTHTAYNDFEIVAANLLDKDRRGISDRVPCYALYTDPPLGRIGMTESQVRKSGRRALIGKLSMSSVKRAQERGESRGFMKVLVAEDTREILGAALLGLNCDEVVHSLLDVMYAHAPSTVVQRAMHIHPTVSEYLPTIMGALQPLGAN
ncbi:MAG TPA: FAD-containing oxidoreductase [Steroidobacteraceae bacterium]|nr:FAD-containing oxidoreductase [Steroidobacteraceae bacterium]